MRARPKCDSSSRERLPRERVSAAQEQCTRPMGSRCSPCGRCTASVRRTANQMKVRRDRGGGVMASEEFRVGEAVRILDGPFMNFVGVVRAVATTQTGLVTVGIGLQGREVPVEVDRYRLERIR